MNQIIRRPSLMRRPRIPFVIAQGRNIETRIYQRPLSDFHNGAHSAPW